MQRWTKEQLEEVLAAPAHEDERVAAMAEAVACRVCQAIVPYLDDETVHAKIQSLQQTVCDVLHWAIHIGQSAWQLLASRGAGRALEERELDWEMAVEELYHRPFVMLDTDDSFHSLVSTVSIASRYRENSNWASPGLGRGLTFTLARLMQGAPPAGGCVMGENAGDREDDRQLAEDHLIACAQLYLHQLEWLVLSSEPACSAEVGDCFVSLCATALTISGDALRLLWPA